MKTYLSFRMLLFVACLVGMYATIQAASFEEATDRLLKGDIDNAAIAYEALLTKGICGSAIYANLGFALQKRNKLAEAALNYYRALMLNPQCIEAKAGLNQLRVQTGLPELTPIWIQGLPEMVTPTFLLIAGEILFWIGAFLQVSGVFRKKLPLVLSSSCLSLLGATVFLVGWLSDPRVTRKHLAIVTTQGGGSALTQPVATAACIASLPSGTPVTVLSERGDWSYCQLADGNQVCWILTSSLSSVYQKPIF